LQGGLRCRLRRGSRRDWRRAGFGGRREHKAFADDGKSLLGEFCLKQLICGAGKQLGFGFADGGFEVVDGDRLAIERTLEVGVGGELDGKDGGILGS